MLKERYKFDFSRIFNEDSFHIEYCITDICNRNCASCSHLAPLAQKPNFVNKEEFHFAMNILSKLLPDTHTFWLTGGEPTLHPEFIELLDLASNAFSNSFVGIYSNGSTLEKYAHSAEFWKFMRKRGVVWAITDYGVPRDYYEELFGKNGCINNLTFVQSGAAFLRLTNYSRGQEVSESKFEKCGWERSKINIRNKKIYNCPSAEFADLFNEYFNENLVVSNRDYLEISENLTREQIEKFRAATPFCGQCDLSLRNNIFINAPSKKLKSEWSSLT